MQNAVGAYYVDSSCVDCDICRNTAPDFFKRDDEIGMSFVYRQPLTPEELSLAEEARLGCPTESIGNDANIESTPALSKSKIENQKSKIFCPCASAATGRVS
jgi:ferredoxin